MYQAKVFYTTRIKSVRILFYFSLHFRHKKRDADWQFMGLKYRFYCLWSVLYMSESVTWEHSIKETKRKLKNMVLFLFGFIIKEICMATLVQSQVHLLKSFWGLSEIWRKKNTPVFCWRKCLFGARFAIIKQQLPKFCSFINNVNSEDGDTLVQVCFSFM